MHFDEGWKSWGFTLSWRSFACQPGRAFVDRWCQGHVYLSNLRIISVEIGLNGGVWGSLLGMFADWQYFGHDFLRFSRTADQDRSPCRIAWKLVILSSQKIERKVQIGNESIIKGASSFTFGWGCGQSIERKVQIGNESIIKGVSFTFGWGCGQ